MKKHYVVFILLFSIMMSSCSKIVNFSKDDLVTDTQRIELMIYNESITGVTVKVIEEVNLSSFIDDFLQLNIKTTFGAPGTLDGYAIKIIYHNGDYHLISKYHMEYRNGDDKLIREDRISLDVDIFDNIMIKYSADWSSTN